MAGELNLKVDQATYEGTIATLESYVNQLQVKLDGYRRKRQEIDEIWEDQQAETYKRGIDATIEKINSAMEATNTQINQLKDLLEKKRQSEINIGNIVETAVEVVDKLFL